MFEPNIYSINCDHIILPVGSWRSRKWEWEWWAERGSWRRKQPRPPEFPERRRHLLNSIMDRSNTGQGHHAIGVPP